ncbi:uncharacterized protein LOC116803961 isoform X1 [Drosophila mojavensis]|uniref:uncharacterized protein LOC116803961 isoform X1 n=1 Tax=Drosophila mojavensis TaxID=7230 RepID=UPI0013EE78D7|nr:uncharacterized protein LOC116803961 isoform X1 [Drosophila mojavensis]
MERIIGLFAVSWDLCVQVVERLCQYLESCGKSESRQAQTATTSKLRSQSIEFHGSRLQEMPVVERYEAAKRHGLCLNSLGKGHQACKSLYSKMSILLETSLHYYIGRRSGGDCNSTDVGDIIL